jgi:hypothetical protein
MAKLPLLAVVLGLVPLSITLARPEAVSTQ